MSENCRYYPDKTNKRRRTRVAVPPLQRQLNELIATVMRCETIWTIEDRIERSL